MTDDKQSSLLHAAQCANDADERRWAWMRGWTHAASWHPSDVDGGADYDAGFTDGRAARHAAHRQAWAHVRGTPPA